MLALQQDGATGAGRGLQNINLNKCNKEHTLFSASNGYGLIQKEENVV